MEYKQTINFAPENIIISHKIGEMNSPVVARGLLASKPISETFGVDSGGGLLTKGNIFYRRRSFIPGNHLPYCLLNGRVSSPSRDSLLPASSTFYLMMSVNLNINKHNNIAPATTTKIKNLRLSFYLLNLPHSAA